MCASRPRPDARGDRADARAPYDFDKALDGAEVVMMLRLQNERMSGQFIPSPREYRHLYGLTPARLAKAAPDAVIMHPGPMNRGIEIDSRWPTCPAAASSRVRWRWAWPCAWPRWKC
jgi:aspartate carbamoyltransferase catalytic subunit